MLILTTTGEKALSKSPHESDFIVMDNAQLPVIKITPMYTFPTGGKQLILGLQTHQFRGHCNMQPTSVRTLKRKDFDNRTDFSN